MLLLSIVLLSGCITTNETIECSDFSCFKEAAMDCSPTEGKITQEFSTGFNDITMVSNMYLSKTPADLCELRLNLFDYTVRFTEDFIVMYGETIDNMEEAESEVRDMFLTQFGSKTSVCVGSNQNIASFIGSLETSFDFDSDYFDLDCQDIQTLP